MSWLQKLKETPKAGNEQTATTLSLPFSQQEAFDKIRKVHAELDQVGPWPESLTVWLQENHSAVLQAIRKATEDIDHACLNQNATGLDRALAEYKRTWLAGLSLWRNEVTE